MVFLSPPIKYPRSGERILSIRLLQVVMVITAFIAGMAVFGLTVLEDKALPALVIANCLVVVIIGA